MEDNGYHITNKKENMVKQWSDRGARTSMRTSMKTCSTKARSACRQRMRSAGSSNWQSPGKYNLWCCVSTVDMCRTWRAAVLGYKIKLKSHLAWEVAVGCQCTLPCPLWLWPGWPWPHPSHWQHGHPDASRPSASPKSEVQLVKFPIPASEKLFFSPHWACCYSGSSSAGPPASPSSHSTPWSSTFAVAPVCLSQCWTLPQPLHQFLRLFHWLPENHLYNRVNSACLVKDRWKVTINLEDLLNEGHHMLDLLLHITVGESHLFFLCYTSSEDHAG